MCIYVCVHAVCMHEGMDVFMCICSMYVCLKMFQFVYFIILPHTHTHARTHIFIYIYIYAYIYTYICTYIYICII